MIGKSRQHLDSVNESYAEHLCQALRFAGKLLAAGLAMIVHALCPALFETTGSRAVFRLNAILCARTAQAAGEAAHDGG